MKTTVVPKGGTGGAFSTATSLLPDDFVQAFGTYSPRNVRSLNSFCFLAGGGSPESIQMVQPLAIPSLKAVRNAQMTRQDPQDTKASAKQGNAIRRANDPVRIQMQRTVKQWLSHYLRLITAFCSPAPREHLFLQS